MTTPYHLYILRRWRHHEYRRANAELQMDFDTSNAINNFNSIDVDLIKTMFYAVYFLFNTAAVFTYQYIVVKRFYR